MQFVHWALDNPWEYIGLGLIVGFGLVFSLLFIGGDPGYFFTSGAWSLVGFIAWLFLWPAMIVIFVLICFTAIMLHRDYGQ